MILPRDILGKFGHLSPYNKFQREQIQRPNQLHDGIFDIVRDETNRVCPDGLQREFLEVMIGEKDLRGELTPLSLPLLVHIISLHHLALV